MVQSRCKVSRKGPNGHPMSNAGKAGKGTAGCRIVYIEWVDSISYGSSVWTFKENVEGKLPIIRTAGFLLREDKESITIVCHYGDSSVSGDMTIPKVAIKKRRVLK